MTEKVVKISDMEVEVMKVIWHGVSPMTYTEIRAALSETFEFKTQVIHTMIKRLVQKKALKEEKREVYYYSPLVTEDEYVRNKTISLVEKVFNGNVGNLFSALVSYEKVTPDDLESLRDLWKKGEIK